MGYLILWLKARRHGRRAFNRGRNGQLFIPDPDKHTNAFKVAAQSLPHTAGTVGIQINGIGVEVFQGCIQADIDSCAVCRNIFCITDFYQRIVDQMSAAFVDQRIRDNP